MTDADLAPWVEFVIMVAFFKNKTYVFILIASLLSTLLLLLIAYICYQFTSYRKKQKDFKSAYTGSKEILEYDSLRFTYDTNIETLQTNFPVDYQKLQRIIPGDGSQSSQSELDEIERQNLLNSIDLVQPLTVSSSSSSECSEIVEVVLKDNTKNLSNGLGRLSSPPISGLGRLSAALFFDKTLEILRVNIIQWNNSGSKRIKSTLSPYVKVHLFPDLKRKFFTKTKRGEDPVFDEEFTFPVTGSELKEKSLHLSVCDFDKFSRQNILGNGVIKLEEFLEKLTLPEGTGELWVNLTESNEMSSDNKGDISYSLQYFPTSGRITLTVVRGKQLNVEDNDTSIAVKASVLYGGTVATSQKTSYHKSDMCNPIFNESWVFDIPSDALEQTSFLICVYAYNHNKKRVIGKATTGSQASSSKTGLAQWNEMVSQPREPILHWHKLM